MTLYDELLDIYGPGTTARFFTSHVVNPELLIAAPSETFQRHVLEVAGGPSGVTNKLPDWLRLSILDTLVQFTNGRAQTCLHDPSPTGLEPLFASARKPGLVTCQECRILHLVGLTKESYGTCDRCGTVTDDDGWIHPCQIVAGRLVFTCGLCQPCFDAGEGGRSISGGCDTRVYTFGLCQPCLDAGEGGRSISGGGAR